MTRPAYNLPEALRGLNPAWFALVMATGIVGLATHAQAIPVVPAVLMWANVFFYVVLWLAYLARMVMFPRAFFGDFRSHGKSMGYFTVVAGTTVLGSQLLQVGGFEMVAKGLWIAGLSLWVLLVYAIPVSLVTKHKKPTFEQGIKGTWLLWAVATQGVSVLGTQVAPSFGRFADGIVFLAFLFWLLGVVFYFWVIELIIRYLFFSDITAGDLSPTYWIDMGAVAISTLAGATLLGVAARQPLLGGFEHFIGAGTLLLWAVTTWWIPWLFIMGAWRHVVMRYPAWYEPGWWGMVFPLGMYTVATATAGQALGLPAFAHIASWFVWLALVAWAATFANMLLTLATTRVERSHPVV